MNNNYPLGAEFDGNAPWNQEDFEKVIVKTVTCSNTLSKDFNVDVYERENLVEAFSNQEFSAKEALDLAAGFAERIEKLAKAMNKKYPNLSRALLMNTGIVLRACKDWNEDELEVVEL